MRQRPYYSALDGVRALAVLSVFQYHYAARLLPDWLQIGWVGVDVFFVLSGFLITGILFDSRNAEHRWRTFYLRRTLRIMPLYYAILLLFAVTTPVAHWTWSRNWLSFPLYVYNMMPNAIPGHPEQYLGILKAAVHHKPYGAVLFDHFWTLCVEEQFYLLWPAVVFLVRDRKVLLRIIACALPFVLVLRCVLFVAFGPGQVPTLSRALYSRADALMLGGAVALLLRGPASERIMAWGGRLLTASVALFCVIGLVAVNLFHQTATSNQSTSWIVTLGLSCVAFASAGLLLLSLRTATLWTRLLQVPWLRWLGQRSYGFYVFHYLWRQPLLTLAGAFLAHVHFAFARRESTLILVHASAGLLLSLAVTAASYRWFEQPILRLKDRWTPATAAGPTNRILHQEAAVSQSLTGAKSL